MRTQSTFLGLAATAALFFSTASAAGPGPGFGHDRFGPPGGPMMMLSELGLSDAQRASVKSIVEGTREQGKALHDALATQREAFEALAPTDAGYAAAAASLAAAEGQAAEKRVLEMADVRARIYAVLTPDQRSQFASKVAEAKARRQQWQDFEKSHPLAAPSGK